jgi:prophage regulatory protein
MNEVRVLTGLGRATIYRLMYEGRFPKALHPLGNKLAAWRATDVHGWVAERASGKAA